MYIVFAFYPTFVPQNGIKVESPDKRIFTTLNVDYQERR